MRHEEGRAAGVVKSGLARLPEGRGEHLLRRLRRVRRPAWRGALRGRPVSTDWGSDRGDPVDRYYVEQFLARHASEVTGRVLEMRDRRYTDRYGRDVTTSHVLDVDPTLPGVTWVDDLAVGARLPSSSYDCLLLVQTLQFVHDVRGALRSAHRVLAPGGVLLVTVPVTSRLSMVEGTEVDHWRFTPASCRSLFGEVFGEDVEVEGVGNLLATIAFLREVAWQELPPQVLDAPDPLHPLVVTVRARKGAG